MFVAVIDSMLLCVAVCCSVLQCELNLRALRVDVSCSGLQFVAVCGSVLQCELTSLQYIGRRVSQCFAVLCSVLQCVAVCCCVLQCVAV